MSTPDHAHARPPAAEARWPRVRVHPDGRWAILPPNDGREIGIYTHDEVHEPGWVELTLTDPSAAQPPPPASEAERVLEGLVEEMLAKRGHGDAWGECFALVVAAHQRLAERDRERERG